MSSAQLAPGTVVETFTVVGVVRTRIGATTYAARGTADEAVEITVYGNDCFPSALVLERSLREIRQLQTVTHPRLVRILGCGKLPGVGTWEAHAPLPAESLAQHLARGPLADADALAIASQIGDALSEAQKVGVIHRNLGAEVVFPSPEGVVVAGFAVGAPLGGKSFGQLDAIAPEQVEGKVVDQRTLIYNLAALVWHMLRGAPLYTGDAATVLAAHVGGELPADLPTTLRRGLAKDPRVRPMMLRQFVSELGQGGSTAPAAGGAPTSRGWTMFTAAIPDAPTPVSAPGSATAATPASAAAASAPAEAGGDVKPTTRGWTMFMQAVDDGAPASASTPTPGATTPAATTPAATTPAATAPAATAAASPTSAAAPTPAAPAAPVGDPAKPTTRGWTMFMQAVDEAPGATPSAATPIATPSSATPIATTVAAQAPAPVASSAPDASATPAASASATTPTSASAAAPPPSSRGWTMFTSAEPTPTPATPASASAAIPVTPTPVAAAAPATPAAPPAAPVDPNKPTTRGWTMFTRDDEVPPPADPAPTPAATEQPQGEGDPPSSRGWTMFMEPGAAAAMQQQASAAAAAEVTPPAVPTPAPAATSGEGDAPSGQRRGWTMFMEAPIAAASPSSLGPNAADPAPPVEAPPVDTASSDNRGWTVFGAPVPTPEAAASSPETSRTVVVTPPAVAPVAHDASEGPTASGQVTASEAPDPAPGRGRTVVAMGVPAEPGTVGGVTGRTVFPASQPAPDTQYFRRGDIPADRPGQRTTAADVPVPATRGPAEERDARALPAQRGNDLPANTGSRSGMLIVVGVVAVAAIVAVVWMVT